jgi:glutathione synthase/RimK-type ligase-like ATP-grasp enzyme
VSERTYWGLFREREHSPGRETDDAEILRLTGKHLESHGVQVELRAPEELSPAETPPDGIFLMCERMEALRVLLAWQERGVRQVNAPLAVLNTYRERMIAQLREANVPFIESRVVATQGAEAGLHAPIWVKRPDVHNTQEGDVVFARTRDEAAAALAALAARGFERAVLQPPVEGDLIKFYGVGGGGGADGGPAWFRWFYHKDQRVAGHPFEVGRLARLVRAAATALGLEVYGGDAIASADGRLVLLDVNAWPSFALYRDEAAPVIAAYLALRFAASRPAAGDGR